MSRIRRFAMLAGGAAVVVGGCGSSNHFVNANRPPTPIDLTVYIGNAAVRISPANVGAGPVLFYVTNQASRSESLTIAPLSGGGPLASTGPINPDSNAQVQVDFKNSGEYAVSTGSSATARLKIGAPRANGDNALLQP